MSFSNLPQVTQDILMVQFEFFGKIFLIGFFFMLAVMYVFVWKKKQQETPYMLVALFRTIFYALSWVYMYFTPLFLIYLYPQVSIDTVLKGTFAFYRYMTYVVGIVIFINIMLYAPLIIAKLGGLNIMSKNTNKVMDDFLGKYKKLFRRT